MEENGISHKSVIFCGILLKCSPDYLNYHVKLCVDVMFWGISTYTVVQWNINIAYKTI